jgi:PPOX class probable F420-dependent enzyme
MTAIPRRVAALLDDRVVAHLATTNADGSPQVSPIWIERDGDLLRFGTAEGRAKLRNLRRDPRLALSITDPSDREVGAVIRGTAVAIEQRGWALIDRLAHKYRGDPSFPRVEGMVRVDVDVAVGRVIAS